MTPMYELYNYYKDKPVKKEYLEKAFNQILDEEPELIPYVEDLRVVDNEMKDLGTYAAWKATKAQGQYDIKTFEVRAVPVKKIEGLRPGMSAIIEK